MGAALALMLWPALLNGFPIVFFDTGGYIEAAVSRELVDGRSLVYGLFLQVTSLNWHSLWGPVLVQAGITLWLLRTLYRGLTGADAPRGGPVLLAIVALLSVFTGMAWYTAQLMPDLMIPLVVAALWLLAFRWNGLSRWTRGGLAAVALLGLMSHMSCMALGAGLVAVLAAMKLLGLIGRPRSWAALRLVPAAAVVAGSVLLLPAINGLVAGEAQLTPGGPMFLFGSLLQQGQVRRLLDDRCPADPKAYTLCPYRHRLPGTADDFLWSGDSPLVALGGWDDMAPEAARVNMAVVRGYPLALALSSLQAGVEQFFRFRTGDGLDEYHDSTRQVMHDFLAPLEPAYLRADQQSEGPTPGMAELSNHLAVPAGFAALAVLALLLPQAVRRRDGVALGALVFLWAALAGNAFICGALSNPHNRYQNRLVWLAPLFAVAIAGRLRAGSKAGAGAAAPLITPDILIPETLAVEMAAIEGAPASSS
ncbi:MAG: hypothetical protein PW843_09645 [Azospirillaceae bacterium]|nr:hypothetical protein [Azospirillaceae bacterium]